MQQKCMRLGVHQDLTVIKLCGDGGIKPSQPLNYHELPFASCVPRVRAPVFVSEM